MIAGISSLTKAMSINALLLAALAISASAQGSLKDGPAMEKPSWQAPPIPLSSFILVYVGDRNHPLPVPRDLAAFHGLEENQIVSVAYGAVLVEQRIRLEQER